MATTKNGIESQAMGSYPSCIDFLISRVYSNTSPELHKISIIPYYYDIKFANELSVSSSYIITKIRYVYDTETYQSYIDIYYNSSSSNYMHITLSNQINRSSNTVWEPIISPSKVEESADGIRVFGTHTFSANTTSIGSANFSLSGTTLTITT